MPNIFITSDTHFGHKGVCEFLRNDGSKLRPFTSVEEMDEIMVERWNSVVKPKDKVYHLGDVIINRKAMKTLARLSGEKVLVKGNHDCLDSETECLTQRGWLNYTEILSSDLVYSMNPTTKIGEWKPIKEIITRWHEGAMWQLESQRFSMLVTENHRVMYKKSLGGELIYDQPENIKGLIYFQTAVNSNDTDYDISDCYLKLIAWYYSDGSLVKHKNENIAVCFWQSKIKGMQKLENLLEEAGITYVKSSRGKKIAGSLVCGKTLIKDSLEAFVYRLPVSSSKQLLSLVHRDRHTIPEWFHLLSHRQVELFVREIIEGDGCWATNGNNSSGVLYGGLSFLNQVQILCVTKGINANIVEFRENQYRLNVNLNKKTKVYSFNNLLRNEKWKKVQYEGFVWCLRTEHTNFMVRRRGQTFFTGNCFKLEEYTEYFKDIRAYHVLDGMIMSHIPLHPESLARFGTNIHGHLHSNKVMLDGKEDVRYHCVCVEHTDYQPIAFEEVKRLIVAKGGSVGFKATVA